MWWVAFLRMTPEIVCMRLYDYVWSSHAHGHTDSNTCARVYTYINTHVHKYAHKHKKYIIK